MRLHNMSLNGSLASSRPMRGLPSVMVSLAVLLYLAPLARADVITVTDIIPNAQSDEYGQNSEPSLAVNPQDPSQMIAGAFSSTFNVDNTVVTPFYSSTDGGATWSSYGSLPSVDKSLAWAQDGSVSIATTLTFQSYPSTTIINTYNGGVSDFGTAVNNYGSSQNLDQPWVRTGPSGQTYVTYNNLSNAGGQTASIMVSADNGSTYGSPVTLETSTPAGGQDAPSVRSAVNGSTVYAVFTRWGTYSPQTYGELYNNSQIVIAKSTDSGASFTNHLGPTTTGYFASTIDTALTLGQQRTSSDVAIAVDPNDANHVVVAYGDATQTDVNTGGLLQLHVIESTDGGTTWTEKFTTSSSVRSALPAVAITANGTIGLLYAQYDPNTDELSQYLVTTKNDFATTNSSLLGKESNTSPSADFHPYLGDFYDLTAVGNTFYGIFSASNADTGTLAMFPSATYLRSYSGTPGTGSFALTANTPFSIDPYVFSVSEAAAVPEPGSLALLGTALLGFAAFVLRRRREG